MPKMFFKGMCYLSRIDILKLAEGAILLIILPLHLGIFSIDIHCEYHPLQSQQDYEIEFLP